MLIYLYCIVYIHDNDAHLNTLLCILQWTDRQREIEGGG